MGAAGGRRRLRRELAIGGKLDREPLEGAPQRLAQRVTDEEDIGDGAAETRALELVGELERHVAAAVKRLEDDNLRAVQLRVLDAHALPCPRFAVLDLLDDAPATTGPRVPDEARLRQ